MNPVLIPFRDVQAFTLSVLEKFVNEHLPDDLCDKAICVFYVKDGHTCCTTIIPRD